MRNRRLKKPVVYCLYALGFVMLLGTLYLIESFMPTNSFNGVDDDYVNETIFDSEIPVINTVDIIIRPYVAKDVKIVKNYYDYKDEAGKQEQSLLFFENTYLQNSGVSYGKEEIFEVISILDGTVTKVTDDKTLGKIVEVTHSNDMISIYQSLSEVNVVENQEIKQGMIIGKSGTCNLEKDLNNHLHFELIVKGLVVNPENYYDKKVSEI
ncbi:MAG: M23 family metallopeptidase [Firmicutes bacterium]|nr:M23 family metallopeptidase [Bacillota bacterium]